MSNGTRTLIAMEHHNALLVRHIRSFESFAAELLDTD